MTEPNSETTDNEAQDSANVVALPSVPPEKAEQRKISRFVQEHPVAVIAGGLAVGLLAAALIPKRNRERVSRTASNWAEMATSASLALARQALDKAEAASDQVRDQAHSIAVLAGDLGDDAKARVVRAGDTASHAAARLNPFHKPEPEHFVDTIAAKVKAKLRA